MTDTPDPSGDQSTGAAPAGHPDVVWHDGDIARETRHGSSTGPGATIWFTGLSGSGKSTVAAAVERELVAAGRATYRLDGDNLRFGLNGDLGFSSGDRSENVRRVGEVARLFADAGMVVLVPVISPYRVDRDRVRHAHELAGLDFVEVFVDTPLEVCEQRDPKGLYARARAGEITDMTGIDAPYEAPDRAELVLETARRSVDELVAEVIDQLGLGSSTATSPRADQRDDVDGEATADGPAFLGIGAQKAGTTWLHRRLSQHPQVWLPPEKELHWFDAGDTRSSLPRRLFGRGPDAGRWRRQVARQAHQFRAGEIDRSTAAWYARYFLGASTPDWYRSLFPSDPGLVAGEITPDYGIVDDQTVARVRRELRDDLRLVLIVRNPIERLWSHAKMEERILGGDAQAIVAEMVDRPIPRRHTDYLATIDRWTRHFPREQLFVAFMEDVAFSPEPLLDAVCEFLGVAALGSYTAPRHVVHRGGHDQMPVEVAVMLADELSDDLAAMADRLGGSAHWWQFAAEQLTTDPPSSALAYPLWESELHERWLAAGRGPDLARLQSSPADRLGT